MMNKKSSSGRGGSQIKNTGSQSGVRSIKKKRTPSGRGVRGSQANSIKGKAPIGRGGSQIKHELSADQKGVRGAKTGFDKYFNSKKQDWEEYRDFTGKVTKFIGGAFGKIDKGLEKLEGTGAFGKIIDPVRFGVDKVGDAIEWGVDATNVGVALGEAGLDIAKAVGDTAFDIAFYGEEVFTGNTPPAEDDDAAALDIVAADDLQPQARYVPPPEVRAVAPNPNLQNPPALFKISPVADGNIPMRPPDDVVALPEGAPPKALSIPQAPPPPQMPQTLPIQQIVYDDIDEHVALVNQMVAAHEGPLPEVLQQQIAQVHDVQQLAYNHVVNDEEEQEPVYYEPPAKNPDDLFDELGGFDRDAVGSVNHLQQGMLGPALQQRVVDPDDGISVEQLQQGKNRLRAVARNNLARGYPNQDDAGLAVALSKKMDAMIGRRRPHFAPDDDVDSEEEGDWY